MEQLQKKTFKKWTKDALSKEFGIKKVLHFEPLESWLKDSQAIELSDLEKNMLAFIRDRAVHYIDGWNEMHLQMNLLGPLITLADFYFLDQNNNQILARDFANEKLEGTWKNYFLSGRPDLMIAMGDYSPEAPYFCFHEYKRQETDESPNDPAGQALIAMLLAQELNEKKRPIYGAYVSGSYWYFMALQDNYYGIKGGYLLTHDSIFDVLKGLKQLKKIIRAFIEEDNRPDN